MTDPLGNYIGENLARGVSKENIKKHLLSVGWQETDIDNALRSLDPPTTLESQPQQNQAQFLYRAKSKRTRIILLAVLIILSFGLIVAGLAIYLINTNKTKGPGIFKSTDTPKHYSHKIAEDPQLGEEWFPVFSPDKEKVIFEYKEGGSFLIPNCKICENYEQINYADFVDKTNQLVFIGYKKSTQKFYLVIGDEEKKELSIGLDKWKQFGPNTFHLSVSEDGKNYLLADEAGDDLIIYFNSEEKGRYKGASKSVNVGELKVSPDGNRFGYSVEDGLKSPEQRQIAVVVDGQIQLFPGKDLRFSPDSKHFAYIGGDAPGFAGDEKLKRFMVIDGVKQTEYIDIGITGLTGSFYFTWSPDSNRFAYTASKSSELISDKTFAYIKDDGILVLDGKEQPESYSAITNFIFSPDSKRYGFFGGKERVFTDVILDGKVVGHFQSDIGTQFNGTYFSPNSSRFAWASGGLFDGGEWGGKRLLFGENTGVSIYLVFSPDSQKTAGVIYQGNYYVTYVDEQKFPSTFRIPIFSPDSKHIAFLENPTNTSLLGSTNPNDLKKNQDLIVNLDFIHKRNIIDPYSRQTEIYYGYSHFIPTNLGYPLIDSATLAFSDDSKYLKINEKRENEYWVTVLDTQTGEEVIKD